MEEAYETWKKHKTPENMSALIEKSKPIINSAIQSYGGMNKSLGSQAKVLAADAIKKFDPNQGVKLRTYIMSQLQPLIRINRERAQVTRIPERVTLDLYKMKQEEQRFHDQYGRGPSDTELSDATGLARKRLLHVRKFSRGEIAESAIASEESGFMPGVAKPDPDTILLEYVHHDLDPVDQLILEHKTGIYDKPILSNNDLAARLRLSPGAVSQRAKKVARRIAELQAQGLAKEE